MKKVKKKFRDQFDSYLDISFLEGQPKLEKLVPKMLESVLPKGNLLTLGGTCKSLIQMSELITMEKKLCAAIGALGRVDEDDVVVTAGHAVDPIARNAEAYLFDFEVSNEQEQKYIQIGISPNIYQVEDGDADFALVVVEKDKFKQLASITPKLANISVEYSEELENQFIQNHSIFNGAKYVILAANQVAVVKSSIIAPSVDIPDSTGKLYKNIIKVNGKVIRGDSGSPLVAKLTNKTNILLGILRGSPKYKNESVRDDEAWFCPISSIIDKLDVLQKKKLIITNKL